MNTDTKIHILFNGKPIPVTWDGKPPIDGWINVVGSEGESYRVRNDLVTNLRPLTDFTCVHCRRLFASMYGRHCPHCNQWQNCHP